MHNELKRGKKSYLRGTMRCWPQRLKSTFFEISSSGAKCVWVVAGLPQRLKSKSLLKSMFFEIFSPL